MSSSPIRVAIVNDYEIVIAGVAAMLAPHQDRVSVVELDSGMPVLSISLPFSTMKMATNTEPTASAEATTTLSVDRAAMVMVKSSCDPRSDEVGVDAQVANDGVLLDQLWHGRLCGGALDESAQGAVAEDAVLQGVATGPIHPFTRVAAGQADQPLEQAVGAYAALDDHRLRPGHRFRQ